MTQPYVRRSVARMYLIGGMLLASGLMGVYVAWVERHWWLMWPASALLLLAAYLTLRRPL